MMNDFDLTDGIMSLLYNPIRSGPLSHLSNMHDDYTDDDDDTDDDAADDDTN